MAKKNNRTQGQPEETQELPEVPAEESAADQAVETTVENSGGLAMPGEVTARIRDRFRDSQKNEEGKPVDNKATKPEAEVAKEGRRIVVRLDKRKWSEVEIERLRRACNTVFGEDGFELDVNWNS